MDTYSNYISQFEVLNNPPKKDGFHRHHIVPVSEQKEPDNRQIYVTPAQHLWTHILYDREHGTKTSMYLCNICGKPIDFFDCFEKCLSFTYTFRKKTELSSLKISEANKGENAPWYGKKFTEEHRKKLSYARSGKNHYNYGKHLTEETKKKMSDGNIGKHWYNDGTISVYTYECPEGFKPGRIIKRNL